MRISRTVFLTSLEARQYAVSMIIFRKTTESRPKEALWLLENESDFTGIMDIANPGAAKVFLIRITKIACSNVSRNLVIDWIRGADENHNIYHSEYTIIQTRVDPVTLWIYWYNTSRSMIEYIYVWHADLTLFPWKPKLFYTGLLCVKKYHFKTNI